MPLSSDRGEAVAAHPPARHPGEEHPRLCSGRDPCGPHRSRARDLPPAWRAATATRRSRANSRSARTPSQTISPASWPSSTWRTASKPPCKRCAAASPEPASSGRGDAVRSCDVASSGWINQPAKPAPPARRRVPSLKREQDSPPPRRERTRSRHQREAAESKVRWVKGPPGVSKIVAIELAAQAAKGKAFAAQRDGWSDRTTPVSTALLLLGKATCPPPSQPPATGLDRGRRRRVRSCPRRSGRANSPRGSNAEVVDGCRRSECARAGWLPWRGAITVSYDILPKSKPTINIRTGPHT